jgi:hypothetical protein
VIVEAGSSSAVRKLSTYTSYCPPGYYCSGSLTWYYTSADFKRAKAAPPLYYYADVYGTVSSARTMTPGGYVLGAYAGNPDFW